MSSYISDTRELGISTGVIRDKRFVTTDGGQKIKECVATDIPLGGSHNAAAAADAEVVWSGNGGGILEAGAAVTKGQGLKPDAQGRAVPATVGTHHVAALALNDATQAGDEVEVYYL